MSYFTLAGLAISINDYMDTLARSGKNILDAVTPIHQARFSLSTIMPKKEIYNALSSSQVPQDIPLLKSNSANGRAAIYDGMMFQSGSNTWTVTGKEIIKVCVSSDADPIHHDAYVLYRMCDAAKNQEGEIEMVRAFHNHFMKIDSIFVCTLDGDETGMVKAIGTREFFSMKNPTLKPGNLYPCISSPAISRPLCIDDFAQICMDQDKMRVFVMRLTEFFSAMILANDKWGFVHNDMHVGNVLYDPSTKNLVLIDYGRAYLTLPADNGTSLNFINRVFSASLVGGKLKTADDAKQLFDNARLNYTKVGREAMLADLGGLLATMCKNITGLQDALVDTLSPNKLPMKFIGQDVIISAPAALAAWKSENPILKSYGWLALCTYAFFVEDYPEELVISINSFISNRSKSLLHTSGCMYKSHFNIMTEKDKNGLSLVDKFTTMIEKLKSRKQQKGGFGDLPFQYNRAALTTTITMDDDIKDIDVDAFLNNLAWERVYENKEAIQSISKDNDQGDNQDITSRLMMKINEVTEAYNRLIECTTTNSSSCRELPSHPSGHTSQMVPVGAFGGGNVKASRMKKTDKPTKATKPKLQNKSKNKNRHATSRPSPAHQTPA
jgi:hypothetical protein